VEEQPIVDSAVLLGSHTQVGSGGLRAYLETDEDW